MARRDARATGAIVLGLLAITGCASLPPASAEVGANYPGTCLPPEFAWPTDFLESLPGESDAVAGTLVGLRLEYVDERWAWRLRSAATRHDLLGQPVLDPSAGFESLIDVGTHEILASGDVELTAAEQRRDGTSLFEAALDSGERWPSPLIIEIARVADGAGPTWRVTTCDTATNEHTATTIR